jgi:hypothetical protein
MMAAVITALFDLEEPEDVVAPLLPVPVPVPLLPVPEAADGWGLEPEGEEGYTVDTVEPMTIT